MMTKIRFAVLATCLVSAGVPAASDGHAPDHAETPDSGSLTATDEDAGPLAAHGWTGGWTTTAPGLYARGEAGAAVVRGSIYVAGGITGANGALSTTNLVERYDPVADRWGQVAPMPVALNHPSAVTYRGDLYVLGGYTNGISNPGVPLGGLADASDAFLRYDPDARQWSQMPQMPIARSAAAAAVIGHKLYVAGGRSLLPTYVTSDGLLRRLDIFDFKTQAWTRGPDMAVAREHVPGVAVGGRFYVLGGRTAIPAGATSAVERYEPSTGSWKRVADMQTPHNGFGAVAVDLRAKRRAGNRIVVFGGEEPSTAEFRTHNEVTEQYNPARDNWRRLADMRTPRGAIAAAAIGRRVYAIEGIRQLPTTSCCGFTDLVEVLRLPRTKTMRARLLPGENVELANDPAFSVDERAHRTGARDLR